jgi:hypothetical protein
MFDRLLVATVRAQEAATPPIRPVLDPRDPEVLLP